MNNLQEILTKNSHFWGKNQFWFSKVGIFMTIRGKWGKKKRVPVPFLRKSGTRSKERCSWNAFLKLCYIQIDYDDLKNIVFLKETFFYSWQKISNANARLHVCEYFFTLIMKPQLKRRPDRNSGRLKTNEFLTFIVWNFLNELSIHFWKII